MITKIKSHLGVSFTLVAAAALGMTLAVLQPLASAQTTTTKYLNGKLAFDFIAAGGTDEAIHTMNVDGAELTKITTTTGSGKWDWAAAWSPDGKKIAFNTNRSGNSEVFTVNADGSNETNISNNAGIDDLPTWSPDGSKIAFHSDRDGDYDIYTMNPDGSNVVQITNETLAQFGPHWSPDGAKLVFTDSRHGNNEIYTMNADGSNQVRITNNSDTDDFASWSPLGDKITFWSNRNGNEDVYIVNTDGSNEARLTTNPAIEWGSAWSPDGTKIAYVRAENNSHDAYIMNSDGTNQTKIEGLGNNDWLAILAGAWQPLPYTVTANDDGSITSTISSDKDYSSTDYSVADKEILTLDGKLGDVTVGSGGMLKGSGSAATIGVQSGGKVNPGNSPGCLSSGNFSLSGTYEAELGGNDPCSGYDQLKVTGTVNLSGGTLGISLVNDFTPKTNQAFVIVDNDGTDAVTATFNNLAEGTTFTSAGVVYKVSYVGGDGNDVVLTALSVPASPNTGFAGSSSLFLLALLGLGGTTFVIRRRLAR